MGTRLCFPALPPLPQGTGLAAAYPGDSGISANPAVLFNDNFEGFKGAVVSWAAGIGGWDNAYGTLTVTRDAAKVHAGKQCIEINHTSALGTHGADKELAAHDTVFVRFYLKFSALFPGVHHAGMGIRGGPAGELFTNHTGTKPNGTNFFTCYLDHLSPLHGWQPAEDSIPPGWTYDYCYHMDQGTDYGDVLTSRGNLNNTYPFSADFVSRPNVTPARNRWTCFEIMVQANTIGSRNGRVALWVDGALIADHPGLRFRTADSIKSRYVSLSTYSSGYVAGQTLWYDDIVMARSYIGPMRASDAAEVRAPSSLKNGLTSFKIHDIKGRSISAFTEEYDTRTGISRFASRERNLPNGLYVWVLSQKGAKQTMKRMVLK